jgi:hypothetical protein
VLSLRRRQPYRVSDRIRSERLLDIRGDHFHHGEKCGQQFAPAR